MRVSDSIVSFPYLYNLFKKAGTLRWTKILCGIELALVVLFVSLLDACGEDGDMSESSLLDNVCLLFWAERVSIDEREVDVGEIDVPDEGDDADDDDETTADKDRLRVFITLRPLLLL